MNPETPLNTENDSSKNNLPTESEEPKKKIKPPKLEDKPFTEFINEHLIPSLESSLSKYNVIIDFINLAEGNRPVSEDKCWILTCELKNGRRFWVCFSEPKITSSKTISIAETGSEPTLLESFLIDEKKITLQLLISRILQRLNGQKWLGYN